jgi:hypothetical protein
MAELLLALVSGMGYNETIEARTFNEKEKMKNEAMYCMW